MTLRSDLVEFVQFLRSLTNPQVTALCAFVGTGISAGIFSSNDLVMALSSISDDVLDVIIAATTGDENTPQEQSQNTVDTFSRSLNVSTEVVSAFGPLFKMFGLIDLLQKVSILQLMKLHEILSQCSGQELHIIQQLKQFFDSADPLRLQVLHNEASNPSADLQQVCQDHLNLPMEQFTLYQPIRFLLSLSHEEFLGLQHAFKLQPLQLYQLIDLLRLQPFDILEMRRTLVREEHPPLDLDAIAPVVDIDAPWGEQVSQVPNHPLRMKIVDQPPEQCIYRRNVKPNPTLALVANDVHDDGNLWVMCSLVRCDEMVEEPSFLTGNAPIQVSSGRLVAFKKLKIMVTSHQQNESLFLLKFVLCRRTPHNPEGQVLYTTFSNPITVLSHSTQLRPAASTVPVVSEVIPISGPTSGGTRVAVIGSNFNDGPGTRVRFDTTDVMPVFHGPGTLICHTPQHAPGTVQVTACNDPRRWSDRIANYTYESPSNSLDQVSASIGLSEKFGLNIASTVQQTAWEGNFEHMKVAVQSMGNVNELDGFGFATLHYAAARGWTEAVQYLLEKGANVTVADKYGNSPLHWATAHQNLTTIRALVQLGAPVDQRNFSGVSSLHVAVATRNVMVSQILLDSGADANAEDVDATTPLHWAAVQCGPDMVSQLLHYGAWVDSEDMEGETPLFWALREENFTLAQSLVEYGASLETQNEDQETVLHLVSTMGNKFILEQLLAAGASASVFDLVGGTAAHDALSAGHTELLSLFDKSLFKTTSFPHSSFRTAANPWATAGAFPVTV